MYYDKLFNDIDDIKVTDHDYNQRLSQCVQDCLDCQNIGLETISYCLGMSDTYPVRSILDCIEICQVTADLIMRGSKLRDELCKVCIEACEKCELFCNQFDSDFQMKACGQACRNCVDSCKEILKMQPRTILN